MTARAPRNRPVTRTQLEFRGTFGGDALRAALSLPASVVDRRSNGLARRPQDDAGAGARALAAHQQHAGRDRTQAARAAGQARRGLPAVIGSTSNGRPAAAVQVRAALGSVLRGALNFDSDAAGLRLGRAAMTFGTADPAFSDAQIVNVGGSVEQAGPGRMAETRARPTTDAKPLADLPAHGQARRGGSSIISGCRFSTSRWT